MERWLSWEGVAVKELVMAPAEILVAKDGGLHWDEVMGERERDEQIQ